MSKPREKGSTVVEFSLVGIPMLFLLVSIVEMARGMWTYHTLSHAVKEGTRFAMVHGENCTTAPNNCTVTLGQVAQRIRQAGVALDANLLSLTFTTPAGSTTCLLRDCLTRPQTWPPAAGNAFGADIEISGVYPFQSAIAMFWPGAGSGVRVGSVNLPAASREKIQF